MKELKIAMFWVLSILFVIFYPMLISIYVFLPLSIGFTGYLLIIGIEDNSKRKYVIFSLIYMLNLEINLSLPLFLMTANVLFFYITIYPTLDILKQCKICVALLSVIFIDLLYFIMIVGYDFIFDEVSIVVDQLLLDTLIVDMVMVFLL
jgi:hypothetical protein